MFGFFVVCGILIFGGFGDGGVCGVRNLSCFVNDGLGCKVVMVIFFVICFWVMVVGVVINVEKLMGVLFSGGGFL